MHQRKSKKILIYFFLIIAVSSINNLSLHNLKFKNIFHNVEVILSNEKKTHNSKRIICSNLII